jgi:hypothetical protein
MGSNQYRLKHTVVFNVGRLMWPNLLCGVRVSAFWLGDWKLREPFALPFAAREALSSVRRPFSVKRTSQAQSCTGIATVPPTAICKE